ncbi:hypothetical protein Cob_v008147 [Colletotrichum orbiculare MAFF 240422]|uniref:Uncharacterized protein n=1 Tax=Colletotrichum orbiculare (strain 104-T / ATCC 96160 / CBS 514.97 / LARS 414 / MAFF 240422) TaxID=1213857 RepID=N4VGK7_COLOR|nr:hypothetical protein Cob_v008147 [Colletotrichum orbiculare MAFF 240422]
MADTTDTPMGLFWTAQALGRVTGARFILRNAKNKIDTSFLEGYPAYNGICDEADRLAEKQAAFDLQRAEYALETDQEAARMEMDEGLYSPIPACVESIVRSVEQYGIEYSFLKDKVEALKKIAAGFGL